MIAKVVQARFLMAALTVLSFSFSQAEDGRDAVNSTLSHAFERLVSEDDSYRTLYEAEFGTAKITDDKVAELYMLQSGKLEYKEYLWARQKYDDDLLNKEGWDLFWFQVFNWEPSVSLESVYYPYRPSERSVFLTNLIGKEQHKNKKMNELTSTERDHLFAVIESLTLSLKAIGGNEQMLANLNVAEKDIEREVQLLKDMKIVYLRLVEITAEAH